MRVFIMLKKFFGFSMTLIASSIVISCQNSSSTVDGDIQYLAVQTESDGKWGMVDSDGKLLFADEFKNEPTAVVNGFFSVSEGEHYSLYAASEKPVLVPGCDDLTSVGVFKDGIIPVTHEKSRITFVDSKGNVKATLNPIGGKEIVACSTFPSEGLFQFCTEDEKYGFLDKDGNVVIEPKYKYVGPFSEGLAIVAVEKNDVIIHIAIDKSGKEIFRIKKDLSLISEAFSDGLMVAQNSDDQCGFLNKKGEFTKVKGKVRRIGEFNSSLFAFMNEEYQWGVMDMNGEVIIRPKYGNVNLLPDGNFFVSDDDKYYIMDKKGDKLQTLEDYTHVLSLNMGKFPFIARDKSTYLLLDKNGQPIGKEEFKGMNWESSVGNIVMTDYFNFDSVLQALVGGLTANGIDKFTLNMPASKLGIKDYSDYVYDYNYEDPELNKKGWRYEVNFEVRTDEAIARREYSDYGYDSKVEMNPNAKVESIHVRVKSDVPCWKELKDKIISEIQAKGYKLSEQNDYDLTFTGKDSRLTVSSYSSGENISINLYSEMPTINEPSQEVAVSDTIDW